MRTRLLVAATAQLYPSACELPGLHEIPFELQITGDVAAPLTLSADDLKNMPPKV